MYSHYNLINVSKYFTKLFFYILPYLCEKYRHFKFVCINPANKLPEVTHGQYPVLSHGMAWSFYVVSGQCPVYLSGQG